jgi:2-aminobenzoate-CoA ligase
MLHIFISNRLNDFRASSTGKPLMGYQAKVVDDELNEVPRGTPGHLVVRGPIGCRYLADDRQKNFVRGGWNVTGDTFVQDADGYFHFAARSDDMIVSGGYNIAGPEVEAALLKHEAVQECAVIGVPDDIRGMVVEAHVVLVPGSDPCDAMAKLLQEHVKTVIAPYKYPRSVVFTDTLPKTESGKIQRFRLKQALSA